MDLREIKNYWEKASRGFPVKGDMIPTSRDSYLGQLEEESILKYLDKKKTVLEIGCGDGSHTVKYAKKVKRLSGIDIVKGLIDIAKKKAAANAINNADFIVGSALSIKKIYKGTRFNCIVSQRCLINLSSWRYQKNCILQIHSLLHKWGLYLLTEGFQDELDNLNIIRQGVGLSKIKVSPYNKNLLHKDFDPFISRYFDIIEIQHYGLYLFLSRVLHPFSIMPLEPKHGARINKAAMKVSRVIAAPNFEKYSYNLFYALRKK